MLKFGLKYLSLLLFCSWSLCWAAPSMQSQAIDISKELRDPSAVNQSLYESNAPQAARLKAKIFELLKEGKSKEEILKYFADRYGEQIRYLPTMDSSTAALWIVPAGVVLVITTVGIGLFVRRKKVNKS